MNLPDQLSEILSNLELLKVEATLIIGAVLVLVAGLIKKSKVLIKLVSAGTLAAAFYYNQHEFSEGEIMTDSIFLTSVAQNFTAIFLLACLLILLFKRSSEHATEFYFFILSILVGSILMMKGNSFLVSYLAIELTSFSAYILTNFSFKKSGSEAGIKYLLFGAVSTAIMLFGFGLIYGVTGTFYLSEWSGINEELTFNVGLLFVIFGLLFKASVVPFHIWVPGTYQSAPNDATAIISIVPKLAAFVLLSRIFSTVAGGPDSYVLSLCLFLGVLTIIFGTFSALKQSNARRMISFGAIAHSGFLLPLAVMNSETSNQVFWWYAAVYSLMNIAIFYLFDEYERNGIVELQDHQGLGDQNSLVHVPMTVVLVSLIGLPPLAGFTAKFFLFGSLWEFYSTNGGVLFLLYLIVAVFATVVSLFFYLRIPYHQYLVKTPTSRSIEFSFSTKIIATLFSIVLLLLFFVPQILTVMQQLLNSPIAHE